MGIIFVIGSITSLILEKYVLANNSHVWLGAIEPVISIIFIISLMLTNYMKFDILNVILAVVYVSLSFIFWGQGNDLYHQRVVNRIYE
ncbi:hypothetical protein [Companilactobacillus pabuli]|jgi:hypothetical protein|uniref:EamA domain-containing protein n=1 Tax=Companilactobacillus pabuli TaxID=2714036 RepID=A0A7L7L0K2_9LACO|nr:hypothetical protein [Companilactobacillus pabuli]AKP02655.1 hypothetical protein ABB45_02900 [Companilactobacillus farciminis]AKS50952.1 hypothetical protein ABB44_02900 [Companilactobacillus farciminis]MDG5114089.1 hypothetical protein [Companilactobacillus pabuli]QMT84834.1 hypothetical protein G6534_09475 [Companilactobacillus pabuli]